MIDFYKASLEKFVGCDCDELAAGTPSAPSIWLFGNEHGKDKNPHDGTLPDIDTDQYSISTQRKWRYNQKAFKLLAAMNGYKVDDWKKFADDKQPFVKGTTGYFKGNLFPFACHDVHHWPDDNKKETGMDDKHHYQEWCRKHRIPAIRSWVEEYQPKVFIGVGIGYRDDFSRAALGNDSRLVEDSISDGTRIRRVFYQINGKTKLVIVPHFSSAYGLNSNALLQAAGEFIANIGKL